MGEYWWQTEGAARGGGRKKKPASSEGLLVFLHSSAKAEEAVEIHRAGDLCPNCGFGRLEHDGYFNVYCPICGFRTGARGACT